MNFQQIKTGKDNYTVILDEVIGGIARIKAFDDQVMNDMLYEFHQKLLKLAQKHGDKEVGFFWDLNNWEKEPLYIIGKKNGISLLENKEINNLVKNTNNYDNVVIMHNHPRNGLFSSADIQSFIDFDSVYLMTAVCNDGTIYMIRKEKNFNPFLMQKYYNEGKNRSKYEALQEQLKKAKKMGLDINDQNNRGIIQSIPTKAYYYGIKNAAKHAKQIGITYRCSVKRKGK